MLFIFVIVLCVPALEIVVDPFFQTHNGAQENFYGWFIEALMNLTEDEDTIIWLAAGTHYIQTNNGDSNDNDSPYLPLESACTMEYGADIIGGKSDSNNSADILIWKRRNPLRYLNMPPDADFSTFQGYGAIFKIHVKTMRCSEKYEENCVEDGDDPAILSLTNPFITFEVLSEFILEDLELTGQESLGKGCQWEDCTWCQPWATQENPSDCGTPAEKPAEECPNNWNIEAWESVCDDGTIQTGELVSGNFGDRSGFPICCDSCAEPDDMVSQCNPVGYIDRCETLVECRGWCPPDEEPTEWPVCCTEQMQINDQWEAECNYLACNYGNYYRCFPGSADNKTDCAKLQALSLFTIGDRAYISEETERTITGAPEYHRDDPAESELFCEAFTDDETGEPDYTFPAFILECGQYSDFLTNGKGKLTMKNVKVSYFQQEFHSLFTFHGRDYSQDETVKTYICHEDTGIELDNVQFEKIRTFGPIILKNLDQTDGSAYTPYQAESTGLPGKITLTDVTFTDINTSVSYVDTIDGRVPLPGIMNIKDFGEIQMTRVTLEKGAFNNWTNDGQSTDYGVVFYFTFIQKLKIDTLTVRKLNLRNSLFKLENMTRSISKEDSSETSFFLNIPCGRLSYAYYKNWGENYCEDRENWENEHESRCWQGDDFTEYFDEDSDELRLQPPHDLDGDTGDEKPKVFEYCHEYLPVADLPLYDQGLQPVVINDVTIQDIFMSSDTFSNGPSSANMIQFSPYKKHASHYNYNLTNWTIERIQDFDGKGELFVIDSNDSNNIATGEATKNFIEPPGILLDNWTIDTVIIDIVLSLEPSAPIRINDLTVRNHQAYYGAAYDDAYVAYESSAIYMIYRPIANITEFQKEDEPTTTMVILYDQTPPHPIASFDENKPADSIILENSTFENVSATSGVVVLSADSAEFFTGNTLTFSGCICNSNTACNLINLIIYPSYTGATFDGFTFTNNQSTGSSTAATSLINISGDNDDETYVTLSNFSVSGNTGFLSGIEYTYILSMDIQDGNFSNNSFYEALIDCAQFQTSHTFSMIRTNMSNNRVDNQSIVYLNSAQSLTFSVSGGVFSRNESTVFCIQSTYTLQTTSTVSNASFSSNSDGAKSADLYIEILYGQLTISNCQFEASTAPTGGSLTFTGGDINLLYPDSIDEVLATFEDGDWPVLSMDSCTFQNFPNIENIIVVESLTYIILQTKDLTVTNNQAAFAHITHAAFADENSRFAYNTGPKLIALTTKGDLYLKDSTFEYNTVSDGVIDAQLARLYIHHSTFQHNLSRNSSGALFFYKIYNATVTDSIFLNNTATQSGSIMFASAQANETGVPIVFEGCTFEENHADSLAGMQLTFVSMRISHHSKFQRNTALAYPGIYLFYSTVEIYDSTFSSQRSTEAAFIRGIFSNVNITGSQFSDAGGTSASIMKISDDSTLNVTSSNFTNSWSANGAIQVELGSSARFIDSNMTYMHSESGCSAVCISRSFASFTNWQMRHSNQTMISVETNSDLRVTGSFFQNSSSPDQGGFVFISDSVFDIDNTDFEDGIARFGGAVAQTHDITPDATRNSITNTRFKNNTANEAGALFIYYDLNAITNTYFTDNVAKTGILNEGKGGAILYQCNENCRMTLTDCHFVNNSADGSGGSIAWTHTLPIIDKSWVFKENQATYGNDVASPPSQISYLSQTTDKRKLQTNNKESLEGYLTGLASGQDNNLNLTFGILDYYGQIVRSNDVYTANLVATSGTELRGTLSVTSVDGLFIFDDLIVINSPGTDASVSITTDAVPNALGVSSNDEIDFSFYVRECDTGEELSDNSCLVCFQDGQKYTFEAAADECTDCPSEAICLGGAEVFPKSGYWRSSWNSTNFYECPIDIACLGGLDFQNYEGEWDSDLGYEGRKCTHWKSDYTRIGKYEWAKCPEPTENSLILVAILVSTMGMIGFITRQNLKAAEENKRDIIGVYIKIMTNYFQIITLVNSFELDWPQFVLDWQEGQGQISGASQRIFSFDWYLQSFDGVVFYNNLIIIAIMPIVIIIMSTIIWAIIGFMTAEFRYCIDIKNKAWILVAFFLIHPNLIQMIFQSFSWDLIDDKLYLEIDMSQACWEGDHIYYAMLVSMPALIVWGMGLPALAIILLRKHYMRSELDDVRVKSIFGFLFNGYRYSTYYWEIIILYRKVFLVFVLVFLSLVSIEVQALVALLIMTVSLVFHMKNAPFETRNLNKLETKSIIAASITIYCGLYYLSGSLNEITKIWFFWAIILVNIHFFITWGIIFIQEYSTKLRAQNAGLFLRLFGKCVSEHKVLQYREVSGPPKKKTSVVDFEMDRSFFLNKELEGDYDYSDTVTKKHFGAMVKDKGLMLFELLKDNEFKEPTIEKTTRDDNSTLVDTEIQPDAVGDSTYRSHSNFSFS